MDIVDLFVVPNRVFTEKVKGDFAGLVERDVFAAKGATADSVRLVLTLLVARTKSVLVDEVDGSCALSYCHLLRLEISFIVCTNDIDMFLRTSSAAKAMGMDVTDLQLARFLELITVAFTFDGASSREEDVLAVAVDIFLPMRKPSDGVVVDHRLPRTRNIGYRHGFTFANVDYDVLGPNTFLEWPVFSVTSGAV